MSAKLAQTPHPKPHEQPLPDWKNPANYPDLPDRKIVPTIQPTEPWKDPEPPRSPSREE